MAVNACDPEEGGGEEFDPQVALKTINCRNPLIGAGIDGLRFSNSLSITKPCFGCKTFGAGIEVFWKIIVDDPSAFLLEV